MIGPLTWYCIDTIAVGDGNVIFALHKTILVCFSRDNPNGLRTVLRFVQRNMFLFSTPYKSQMWFRPESSLWSKSWKGDFKLYKYVNE